MLSKAVDPAGVITLYQRDAAGNVLQLTEAAGLPEQRVTVFAYNSAGKLVTERVTMGDGMGTTERSYTYDADGRIATRTDETGKVTRYEDHDANGYATRVVDPDNRALQFVYDASGRMKSRQDALGNRWQFEHDAFNNVTATIDAAGGRSETYYTIENLPSRTKDVFGTETSRIKYGPDGRITEQRDAAGRVTVNSYDDFGRLWKVTNPSGEVIEYRYKDTDPEGARPAEIVYPTFTRKLDYEYATRKVTTTDWVGGTKLRTTIHEIDTRGNVVAITDNEGRSQTFGYDALGRMTRAESAGGLVEVFGYNRFDQLTTYTSPDEQVWEYGYSDDGLRVSETSPEGRVRRFEYTDAGKLERTIEANGDVEEIGYDAGGRATSYEYAAGATPAVVQKAVTFSYDADGRISGYTMPGSSAVYGYDAKGRKTSESVNYGAFTKTQSWTYNADDSLATHTNAAGTVIEYLYDAGGRLESIELPGVGQITYGSRYGGRVGAITLPGGVTQTFSYDPLLRPTGMTMRKADGTAVYAWTEAFDGLNQVQERVMDGVTESFGFDASGRLTMAGGTAFTYDGRGNRTSRTGVPGLWVYNDDDELETAGGAAFGYDARGNRTSRTGGGGNQGYTYDAQGLLTTVVTPAGTVSYRYDPFGRRLAKTVGGVTTYFSPSDDGIEAEFDAAGNEVASYGYDPASEYGQRALWKKVGPVYYWYGFDKLGTPCVMVDSDGVVVWKASYDVFGAATVTVATVENHLRLPGQYFDAETGLHYNWRRYYDPATGRFLSRDPVRDEYNHFLYAQNNPLTKFDPDGLRAKVSVPIPPGGGICKVYTSLDFCECGVKCGGSLGSSKAKGAGCELAADVDLCNGRNGNGPGGFPAPKVCVAAGCKVGDGTCKAELLKACYDFSKKKWAASGPAVGCKAKGPGKSEGEIKTPPIFRSGERDGWGY
jgi:RHS repeat-associated protein